MKHNQRTQRMIDALQKVKPSNETGIEQQPGYVQEGEQKPLDYTCFDMVNFIEADKQSICSTYGIDPALIGSHASRMYECNMDENRVIHTKEIKTDSHGDVIMPSAIDWNFGMAKGGFDLRHVVLNEADFKYPPQQTEDIDYIEVKDDE